MLNEESKIMMFSVPNDFVGRHYVGIIAIYCYATKNNYHPSIICSDAWELLPKATRSVCLSLIFRLCTNIPWLPNITLWNQKVKVAQSCPTLCHPWTIQYMEFSSKNTGVGSLSFSRGSSHPGIELRSPTLQVDSLPAEPQGKPKSTGVGSLSLFQRIFPTQELNWGLLHCRRILYQLSYEGSPR